MRVLVFGGRDYEDRWMVDRVLDDVHNAVGISVVVEGEAPGADTLGKAWARKRGVDVDPYPADWDGEGRSAGPKRNQRMLDEGRPELGVAFPGGRGTADMRRRLDAAGVRVIEVDEYSAEYLKLKEVEL